MPLVQVTLAAGRSADQVRALLAGITEAVVAAVDVPPENVRVVVYEVPKTHWAAGNVTLQERANGVES